MAFYLIKHEDKYYINRDLAKAHFDVGEAGLFALIADGVLTQKKILDCFVYGEGSRKVPRPGHLIDTAIFQDLDSQTDGILGQCGPETTAAQKKIDYFLPIPKRTSSYTLNNTEYVRVLDIADPRKYRLFDRFPTVTFLGKKYIAVNAISKNADFIARFKA